MRKERVRTTYLPKSSQSTPTRAPPYRPLSTGVGVGGETGIRVVACLPNGLLADMHGSIEDINKSCLEQFKAHYECLDNNNHQLWQCRPAEWRLNKCVFHNLVCCLRFVDGDIAPHRLLPTGEHC